MSTKKDIVAISITYESDPKNIKLYGGLQAIHILNCYRRIHGNIDKVGFIERKVFNFMSCLDLGPKWDWFSNKAPTLFWMDEENKDITPGEIFQELIDLREGKST